MTPKACPYSAVSIPYGKGKAKTSQSSMIFRTLYQFPMGKVKSAERDKYVARFTYQFPMGKVKSISFSLLLSFLKYQFPMGKVKSVRPKLIVIEGNVNSLWER